MIWTKNSRLLGPLQRIFGKGVEQTRRGGLDFTGNVTVADDAANDRTTVTITRGAGNYYHSFMFGGS